MAQATLDITAGKFDKAYKDLQKAKKGYKALGDISYQVNVIGAMALLKSNMGEWALAQQHFQEALDIATKANDEISFSRTLAETVSFCKKTGDVKGYNLFVGKLDSLYKKTSSAIVKTCYHTYWSNEYVMRQEYAMAEYHLQQCWDVMQELPLMEREQAKLSHYNNMMALYKRKKEYDRAVEYAKKYVNQSKIINEKNSNLHLQAFGLLADLYIEKGDSINAFAALDSLESGVGLPNQSETLLATFYNIKGGCYASFKDYDKAMEYFDKSSELLRDERIEETPSKYECYQHKAEALYRQKRYDDAYNTYIKCVQACKNKYGETSGNYYQTLYTLACIDAER